MNVLIAGGSGMIGSALAQSLGADGHQVIILSRRPEHMQANFPAVSWEPASLESALSQSDAVINLAGESLAGSNPLLMRWTKRRKASIISSRVESGSKLITAIRNLQTRPEVLIQASAIGYYGNLGSKPVEEGADPGTDFLALVCREWEKATSEAEQLGLRRVVLRIGLVLSRQGGLLPLLSLPFRFHLGGRLATGTQYMSWIHIEDVINGIKFLLKDPTHQGSYNLTAPAPVINQEFSRTLGKTLGSPSWLPVPAPALKLVLGEAATMAVDGRQVYPNRLLRAGFDFKYPELQPALNDLLA